MTFEHWTALVTEQLKRRFPALSVLDRNPGICYVNGIAALDMVELVNGEVRIVRHKDPMTLKDGRLMSRHKGMALEVQQFAMDDTGFSRALGCMRDHLDIIPNNET